MKDFVVCVWTECPVCSNREREKKRRKHTHKAIASILDYTTHNDHIANQLSISDATFHNNSNANRSSGQRGRGRWWGDGEGEREGEGGENQPTEALAIKK